LRRNKPLQAQTPPRPPQAVTKVDNTDDYINRGI
jgi:hypothetical protein